MISSVDEILAVIRSHTNFVLTTHVNPDGDGLGSELALARALRLMGKSARIINHSQTPENYLWMDAGREIVIFSPVKDSDAIRAAEVIVILDTNQPERLRSLEKWVRESGAVKIVIDHHREPDSFADRYLVDDDATSTGEMVYRLLLAGDVRISREIAIPLYTAIMTDTGSFRYPRTDSEIHRIAADLLDCGADPTESFANVYEQWSSNRLRLLGEALESMTTAYDGRLAYIACTQKMFRDTGTNEVDTDNFTSYPMSIKGVVVGLLFNELKDGVKVSFRSKGDIPINELAKEFGGNGHLNAAGARLRDRILEEVVASVIARAERFCTSKEEP